jgi:hypothetical protein
MGKPTSSSGAPESIKARPGDILALRAKTAGTFEAADSSQFLDSLRYYVTQLSPLTDIPLKHFADPGQQPAQGSLQAADAPLRARITSREMSLGYSYGELMKLALEVEGRKVANVQTHWVPQEIELGKDFWESAQIQLQSGIPAYFVFKSAGIPEETLRSWGLNETDAKYQPPVPPQLEAGSA